MVAIQIVTPPLACPAHPTQLNRTKLKTIRTKLQLKMRQKRRSIQREKPSCRSWLAWRNSFVRSRSPRKPTKSRFSRQPKLRKSVKTKRNARRRLQRKRSRTNCSENHRNQSKSKLQKWHRRSPKKPRSSLHQVHLQSRKQRKVSIACNRRSGLFFRLSNYWLIDSSISL